MGNKDTSMGPDFNNDGRADGYDMEYLGGSGSSGGTGCGGCFKTGCLAFAFLIALSCVFSACTAIFYNG